ncbi:MAG: prepilin-type N-terminal cleavage/methylation domain-containing protein [Candidatus Riflebacteria bacterium]|nr:prepilin-type N-terminal cleavage/methylation domain-containing protein [Candidatus Riflebacteria bacterium]
MKLNRALSLVEILVAIVILSLAVGPMFHVLTTSNKVTNASAYEVMAVHYASELSEQIQRLGPFFRQISLAASKNLKDILEDPLFLFELDKSGNNPDGGPRIVKIPGTSVAFLVSALHNNFLSRTLYVKSLNKPISDPNALLTTGKLWDVTISLAWKLSPGDPITHMASYSVVVRED